MTEPKPTLEELAEWIDGCAVIEENEASITKLQSRRTFHKQNADMLRQSAQALRNAQNEREGATREAIRRANSAWDLARDCGEDHLEAHRLAMEAISALLPTKPEPTQAEGLTSTKAIRLELRDTGLHDDLGGGGQRIWTTAGQGYKTTAFIEEGPVLERIAQLERELNAALAVPEKDIEREFKEWASSKFYDRPWQKLSESERIAAREAWFDAYQRGLQARTPDGQKSGG